MKNKPIDSGTVVEPTNSEIESLKPSDSGEDKPSDSVKKKARVLVDGSYGRINTVVELTDPEMAAAKSSGEVDDHPDSVRYAETLAGGQS